VARRGKTGRTFASCVSAIELPRAWDHSSIVSLMLPRLDF
jgi:hypothetical protein